MRQKGTAFKLRKLKLKAFKQALLKKAGEEASALPNTKQPAELILELADLLAVIGEVRKVFGVSTSSLKRAVKNNFKRKGGFKKRLFLVWAQDAGYKTNEKRGRKR